MGMLQALTRKDPSGNAASAAIEPRQPRPSISSAKERDLATLIQVSPNSTEKWSILNSYLAVQDIDCLSPKQLWTSVAERYCRALALAVEEVDMSSFFDDKATLARNGHCVRSRV